MPSDNAAAATSQPPKKDPRRIITPKARLNYFHGFTPRPGPSGGEPMYSYVLVFEKDADLTEMKNAAWVAAQEKWGDKAKTMKLRSPFRPNSDREGQEGFPPGGIFITCRSNTQPQYVDEGKRPITSADELYSGCYARAALFAHAYETAGNRGITFIAGPLQRMEKAARLDNRMTADVFEPLPGAELGPFEDEGASAGADEANPFG